MLAEKTALLELMNERFKATLVETHHRLKNNLQTLSALVDLQAVANDDGSSEGRLRNLKLHIRGLAAIHELLTRDDRAGAFTDTMSAKDALDELLPLLRQTVGAEEIGSDLEEIHLPLRMGMSLTILVNELVTNAVKHGGRRVEMRLYAEEAVVNLEVSDDGNGFPIDFDPVTAANTGLELVERICRWDLRGETRYINRPEGGASVTVSFPCPAL
jgi:two-component sensor histidine kinase